MTHAYSPSSSAATVDATATPPMSTMNNNGTTCETMRILGNPLCRSVDIRDTHTQVKTRCDVRSTLYHQKSWPSWIPPYDSYESIVLGIGISHVYRCSPVTSWTRHMRFRRFLKASASAQQRATLSISYLGAKKWPHPRNMGLPKL